MTPEQIAQKYCWPDKQINAVLAIRKYLTTGSPSAEEIAKNYAGHSEWPEMKQAIEKLSTNE